MNEGHTTLLLFLFYFLVDWITVLWLDMFGFHGNSSTPNPLTTSKPVNSGTDQNLGSVLLWYSMV